MDDVARLVEQAQAGDVDAFTELVRRYQAMAFGYAYATAHDFPNPEIPWEVPAGLNPKDRGDHSRGRRGPQQALIYRHAEKPPEEEVPADGAAVVPPQPPASPQRRIPRIA